MEKLPIYIRPTIFLSIVLGAAIGILLAIPIIQLFIFFAFWIIGGIIVFLLRPSNFLYQAAEKEGIIIGCVSGFISIIAATITFLPLSAIVGFFYKAPFVLSFFSSLSSFVVLIMLVFCIAIINMIFNIASALLVIYIFNNLTKDTTNNQIYNQERKSWKKF